MENRPPIPWCDRRRTYCGSGCSVRDKSSNSGACDWEAKIAAQPNSGIMMDADRQPFQPQGQGGQSYGQGGGGQGGGQGRQQQGQGSRHPHHRQKFAGQGRKGPGGGQHRSNNNNNNNQQQPQAQQAPAAPAPANGSQSDMFSAGGESRAEASAPDSAPTREVAD